MPIFALVVITLVVLLFIIVGDINSLAPIVTTSFMLSYAAVNYAYFALAMSYDKRQARELRYGANTAKSSSFVTTPQGYGSTESEKRPLTYKDSFQTMRTDLDKLFPERLVHHGPQGRQTVGTPTDEPDFDATQKSKSVDNVSQASEDSQVLLGKKDGKLSLCLCFLKLIKSRAWCKTIVSSYIK